MYLHGLFEVLAQCPTVRKFQLVLGCYISKFKCECLLCISGLTDPEAIFHGPLAGTNSLVADGETPETLPMAALVTIRSAHSYLFVATP